VAATTPETPLTGPVGQTERINSLDVLRGVALFGILLINIQVFAMPGMAWMNPHGYGHATGADYWVWLACHALGERKFMTVFSILFGAGIVLMSSRREARGERPAGIHYRRMAVLLGFGLLHAYLLWAGDILFHYALCGIVAYLFRRRGPKLLFIVGGLSFAVPSILSLLAGWSMPYWEPDELREMAQLWVPSGERLAAELEAYRGGWFDQMHARVPGALFLETVAFGMEIVWRAGGLMLIGMGLFKLDVLTAKRSVRLYAIMIAVAVLVGLPLIAVGVQQNEAAEWSVEYSFFSGSQYNYWASIPVSLGWIGLVMLMCRQGLAATLQRRLAAVGQMALTNYLLQSVLCTFVFYGHGFGLFGNVDRLGQLGVVVGVWLFEIVVSGIWLRHFRFGPMEWLWRSLTYMRRQPMRRLAV